MKQTIKKVKVALDFQKISVNDLTSFADGVVGGLTGNASLPTPPVSVATLTTQITALRNTMRQVAAGNTSKTLTAQIAQQANALMLSLISDGHYVEDTANITSAGDTKRAEGIIDASGFKLKKRAVPHPRDFEVVNVSPGLIHYRTKKARKGTEGHLWRYGTTTAKGTAPTTVITRFTLGADIIISDLASGTIIGAQHASILPTAHTVKTDPSANQTSKAATEVPLSKTRHPRYSNAVSDPYQWTDFIYAVIP